MVKTKVNKLKGNLSDRFIINNNCKNKSFRKSKKELINKLNHKKKNEIGYQTQRELTYFKNKRIEKINLEFDINSLKKTKSPNIIKSVRR